MSKRITCLADVTFQVTVIQWIWFACWYSWAFFVFCPDVFNVKKSSWLFYNFHILAFDYCVAFLFSLFRCHVSFFSFCREEQLFHKFSGMAVLSVQWSYHICKPLVSELRLLKGLSKLENVLTVCCLGIALFVFVCGVFVVFVLL